MSLKYGQLGGGHKTSGNELQVRSAVDIRQFFLFGRNKQGHNFNE